MAFALQPHPAGLACAGCGRLHPVVDGIPLVLRDLDAWLEAEAVNLLARELPEPVMARVAAGAGGPLLRDQRLLAVYGASQEGPLQDWTRARVSELRGRALDLGCGAACYDARESGAEIVGMDVNITLLRRFRGQRVLGDAHDPPFLGERFDAVLLFNLLDSCREPFLVLQQADALLRPGGRLLLSCAFAWQDGVTPPANRFDERFLLQFLGLRGYDPGPAGVLELDWPLAVSSRTRHLHRALALDARKPAARADAAPR